MGRTAIIPRGAEPAEAGELSDLRFRALLGSEAWAALPAAVRRRFSKRMGPGKTVTYRGEVTEIEAGFAGVFLAQIARLIGAPLPLWFEPGAAIVSVTEDRVGQGQVWTRLYVRPNGFPQVIHSAKRFAGPTGLEEQLGLGVGMALRTTVEAGVLTFRSAFYFIDLPGFRLRLPRWAEPGELTVIHAAAGEDRFVFGLDLIHPLLGRLIRQRGLFEDDRE